MLLVASVPAFPGSVAQAQPAVQVARLESRAAAESATPAVATGPALDAPRPGPPANALAAGAAAWSGRQVVVYKSKRTLAVYRDGVFEREFRVVLGLVPEGHKRHANDARTPEGFYRVSGKRRHDKWQHFLALDYPNDEDRARYETDVRRGAIPDDGGKPFGIGGDIGIHGNDREKEQAGGVDWTKGCIALSADDIEQLSASIPVGTPVWIVK